VKPRRALLFAVLAIGASGGAPLLFGSGGPLEHPLHGISTTGLAFASETAAFGTIWTGERVTREFAFENPTAAPIRILDVAPTCGCVTVQAPLRYVEPGTSGTIRATFASDGRFGPQTLRIRVRTDEGRRSGALLTLTGHVRAPLRLHPSRLLLGAVVPGATHEETVALERQEPIADATVTCRGEGLSAELAGDALRVTARIPWATGTRFNGVAVSYRIGDRQLETWLPVVWTVPQPFEVSPEELEIADGRGMLTVRPRWPDVVRLARVDTKALPLEAAREELPDGSTRLRFTLRGSAFDAPSGATVELWPEPDTLGPVAVPVFVEVR